MSLLQRVLALLDRLDPVYREYMRQDKLNERGYRLYRMGFTYDQKHGRVAEAVPTWMVNNESSRTSKPSSGEGTGTTESRAILYLHKRPPLD